MSNQGYNCYQAGYDSGKANSAPSDHINDAITIGGCLNTPGGKESYDQGYIDAYNNTNPFSDMNPAKKWFKFENKNEKLTFFFIFKLIKTFSCKILSNFSLNRTILRNLLRKFRKNILINY